MRLILTKSLWKRKQAGNFVRVL